MHVLSDSLDRTAYPMASKLLHLLSALLSLIPQSLLLGANRIPERPTCHLELGAQQTNPINYAVDFHVICYLKG